VFEEAAMERLIHRCAELHVRHIATSGDPFEFGSARPLDFGHWAAHKLEQITHYKVRHGEAVAMGIALDVIYSRMMGYVESVDCERILNLLRVMGFDLFHESLLALNDAGEYAVLAGLEEFREHLGGILTITLIRGIGQGFETNTIDHQVALKSMLELKERFPASSGSLSASTSIDAVNPIRKLESTVL
jgi:3-dehydroquinate synthase